MRKLATQQLTADEAAAAAAGGAVPPASSRRWAWSDPVPGEARNPQPVGLLENGGGWVEDAASATPGLAAQLAAIQAGVGDLVRLPVHPHLLSAAAFLAHHGHRDLAQLVHCLAVSRRVGAGLSLTLKGEPWYPLFLGEGIEAPCIYLLYQTVFRVVPNSALSWHNIHGRQVQRLRNGQACLYVSDDLRTHTGAPPAFYKRVEMVLEQLPGDPVGPA